MKKIKLTLACLLTAAALSCTSAFPTVFAEEELPDGIVLDSPPAGSTKLYDSLENVIKSYGDKVAVTPIIYDDINRIRTAFVITEDCRCFCIRETGAKTVTMKDGTFPPSEKINEAKAPIYSCSLFNKLSIEGENIYSINLAHNDTVAYDILMSDSNVVSVGETPIVYTSRFFLNGIEFKNAEEFNNKESYEKFYNEYSALNLIETVEDDWGYRMQGFYCNIENTPETFEALKKLCESGNYNLCQGCPVPLDEFTSSVTNLYTADPAKTSVGDVNADNTVDLTDLSELALAVIGDIELTDSQNSAADINGDGEVNVSDLARLKQFVSNSITSLR